MILNSSKVLFYTLIIASLSSFVFAMEKPLCEDLGDGLYLYNPKVINESQVAFFVHGFNAKPILMEPAIQLMLNKGIKSYLFALPGHRSDESTMDSTEWAQEVRAYLIHVMEENKNKKIIVVGHSLGGSLVFNAVLSLDEKLLHWAKDIVMVLLAPANGLKYIPELNGIDVQYRILVQNLGKDNSEILNIAKTMMFMSTLQLKGLGHQICGDNAYSNDLTLGSLISLLASSETSCSEAAIKIYNEKKPKTIVIANKKDALIDVEKLLKLFGDDLITLELTENPILAHTFQMQSHIEEVFSKVFSHKYFMDENSNN